MRERWIGWRNAILANPAFQRYAASLWPTRAIARRHARRLFDLVAGFTYSQTLFACVQIDLFAQLANGPASSAAIGAASDLPPAAIARLLHAAEGIGLVERLRDGRVALGSAGAALVANPGVIAMIAHHHLLYRDLADPVALLRHGGGGGALAGLWAYAPDGAPDDVAAYSTLMASSHEAVATQILDAYDVSRHSRLLDVGGGDGIFLDAVRRRAPGLALGLFDLPAVAARARKRLPESTMIAAGSFLTDPLPRGYDLVTLMRVLHDHDDAAALALLTAVRAALTPGGTLLIGEPMARAGRADPVGATYFGLYLLAMGSGRARTPAEIGGLLAQAGFDRWQLRRTALPLVASAITAQ